MSTIITRDYIAKVFSEILSDQYDAKITVIFEEENEDVQNMPTNTVSTTVSVL